MTHVLSPAGDMLSLKAAVDAGADEVYFGLSSFNARSGAANFTPEQAAEAIEYCRLYGVETDITLNTLLYGREYAQALSLVEKLEKLAPPNAYIVQDTGLARALVAEFPFITLHASTQMQVHGSYAAPALKRLGFSRAVLAREMTEEEIASFAGCGLQTEVFVHGAICVCRSGACLMSSMIGKRSGNRGECAYPCRMEYNGKYPLSLKDMCLAKHIPRLLELGVDALKIEGRMRSPEYVYAVTSVYRRLIDERRAADDKEIEYLARVFSRSGFTDGYFTGRRSGAMFGVRTERDKELTRSTPVEIVPRRIPLKIDAVSPDNAPFSLTLSSRGETVTLERDIRKEAQSRAATPSDVEKQLVKLGGTPFYAENVSCDVAPNGFYPVSALNALRRDAVDLLERALVSSGAPQRTEKTPAPIRTRDEARNIGLTVRFEGREVSEKAFFLASRAVFPIENAPLWERFAAIDPSKISLLLPGFVFEGDAEKIKKLLAKAKEKGVSRATLPNFTFAPLCEGFTLDGGYELNCISPQTAGVLYGMGFDTVCASPESRSASFCDTAVVYGRLRLMNTRNCIIKNCSACTHGEGGALRDRTGASFPVVCGPGHTNVIYNSVPVWLLDKDYAFSPTVIFTDETVSRQESVLRALGQKKPADCDFTRAYMAFK